MSPICTANAQFMKDNINEKIIGMEKFKELDPKGRNGYIAYIGTDGNDNDVKAVACIYTRSYNGHLEIDGKIIPIKKVVTNQQYMDTLKIVDYTQVPVN